ncbi:anti-anti-sigma factor [Ventosimonas gracilis]|uniref:Anti-anti-sigma factor n=1 Tax=Ventosimonas gracilis TaxID=1680762 RepID=A0A139SQL9_9GAMM|nr:STAS domain-containing protein [Ventosimonas gracilis]KXU36804.1 anti-anti-sigma factor [Ventosimonas gracilis]
MSDARIEAQADHLQLFGVLDYLTAPKLREQGKKLIGATKATAIQIDCSGVTHSSSVGLALLLGFMRDAKALGKTLAIGHLPEEMRQIAQVSGIAGILTLG